MGDILIDGMDDWAEGVVTSARADAIPPNSSQRGWNSELTYVSGEKAVVRKRRGVDTLNATPVTGSPAVIGQYLYRPNTAGVLSNLHLLVTDNGRLEKLASGSLTNLSTALDSTSPLPPDFETANNLCFICNGTDKVKVTSGSLVQSWGITRPASAPTAVATGAGVMTGTYDVAITYYNSVTGEESSLSDTTSVVLAAQQLRVTIPNAPDTQVDYIRVYIRKQTLSSLFFRVMSGTGFVSTNDIDGWPDNYGNVDFNFSDSDLNLLIILAPSTTENDPPPDGIRYNCWHLSRMFVSDGTTLFYSKVELPESFDPDFEEPINPDDGQLITGLHSVGGVLLIFKSRSIYGLFGDDPNSWYVRLLDSDTGCTSFRSIVSAEGNTFWWSVRGPVMVGGDSMTSPQPIGFELIRPDISESALAYGQLGSVVAAADTLNQRVVFGVAETGQTRQTLLLPFSYRRNRWESTKWDPMDAASLATILDTSDQPYISLGGYAGQVFRMSYGDTDGVPSGTTSGTFTASGTSVSVITDALATFLTTGGALVERKVTLLDADGAWVGRGRIASNTGTALTLAAAISGLTNGAVYTYYVGGPDFQWDLPWRDFQLPFYKKRFEFLYLQAVSASSTSLYLDLAFNWDSAAGMTKTVAIDGQSALWDADVWDTAVYGTQGVRSHRIRVGRTGRTWRLRIRNPLPAKPVYLLKVSMQAERMTSKS